MQGKWIWRFGDLEQKLRFQLEIRREFHEGFYPPLWEGNCYASNVMFFKDFFLDQEETVEIFTDGGGLLCVNDRFTPFNKPVRLPAGKISIRCQVGDADRVPALLIRGETVYTDESWNVSEVGKPDAATIGCWDLDDPANPPSAFSLPTREHPYNRLDHPDGSIVLDAGRECFCKVELELPTDEHTRIRYGESLAEALSEDAIIKQTLDKAGHYLLPARALRYLYISNPNVKNIRLHFEYLPLESRGVFSCSDPLLNQIRDVAEYTLSLNSREFFLDGIKRDRWVWSGDAYQSYLLNYYSFFDRDICKRTMTALGGGGEWHRHINTILDYSFYWIIALHDYYLYTADLDYLKKIWPRAESLAKFCLGRLDTNGLAAGLPEDWVFIDWSDIDKTGAVCAEQMLFCRALEVMAEFAALLGQDGGTAYAQKAREVREKLELFWDEEKGGYIDSFTSGKRNVTRHANIFALLFGLCDKERKETIIQRVLENPDIPAISTPYFQFYQLDALCRMEKHEEVTAHIRDYWGGMLALGATSFWEQYDPQKSGDEHYQMYGDAFGCSLCHAWGASPIYLFGRHYLGVRPLEPGYTRYEVTPHLGGLAWIKGTVPVPDGKIEIYMDAESVQIHSDIGGGTLFVDGKTWKIPKNIELTVKRNTPL